MPKLNFTDLTSDDKQGSLGIDYLTELINPGVYKLRFKSHEGRKDMIVNVVSTFTFIRSQFIVVADAELDYMHIFYYNGNEQLFKPNFDIESDADWIDIFNSINQEFDEDEN